jgi:hypothetical protein
LTLHHKLQNHHDVFCLLRGDEIGVDHLQGFAKLQKSER